MQLRTRHFYLLTTLLFVAGVCRNTARAADPPTPQAIVLDDPALPGYNSALPRMLDRTLTEAGYTVVGRNCDALLAASALDPGSGTLLVLPQARRLPASLQIVVTAYLKRGGNLIVLGAPAWQSPLTVRPNGSYSDVSAAQSALEPPTHTFLEFGSAFPLRALTHRVGTQVEIVPTGGAAGLIRGALHVVVPNSAGVDLIGTPPLRISPFAPGETITTLSARGDGETKHLSLEWDNRDGSRWIAVISLSEQWQRYSLKPQDFHPWQVADRSVAKQGFQPDATDRLRIGLSPKHTGHTKGRQEYWVAGVGTAIPIQTDTPGTAPGATLAAAAAPANPADSIPLETIAPSYKFFAIHGPTRLTTPEGQAIVTPMAMDIPDPAAKMLDSAQPRPGGAGFLRHRSWRWQPLLEAQDARTEEWRGVPATLLLHTPGSPFGGGTWAVFAIGDSAFYQQDAVQKMIGDIARRMRTGLYLIDGGAEYYTTFPGQAVRMGATVANLGSIRQSLDVRVAVTLRGDGSGKVVWERTWPLTLEAGTSAATDAQGKDGKTTWTPPTPWPTDGCTVTTELIANGQTIDRLRHSLYDWEPSPTPHFVTIGTDGHFYRDGALWRANGVNYVPSSGVGQEDYSLFQFWFDAAAYDPDVIDRDLTHIAEMGLNAVSVFSYARSEGSLNLLDFLRRCRLHHLQVDLQLGGGVTKADANGLSLIPRFHLKENDTLISYGIAWEPEFGGYAERVKMDPAWQTWIAAHYGTAATAERAWGTRAPRAADGSVTGPSNDQLEYDGSWHKMVVAYRHFLDDWIVEKYHPGVEQIRALDPHHSVSFRMNYGGAPTHVGSDAVYTFEGQAAALDLVEPEGYGLVGGAAQLQPGLFEVAYARAVAPDKPLVWQEVGVDVWDNGVGSDDPAQMDFAGHFYHDFYRMAMQSGSDGIYWWCYPGGARATSGLKDFGIINPDGTDRPAAAAIRRDAAAFLAGPLPPTPDLLFSFNRDNYIDGEHSVYELLKERYYNALAQGRHPALVSKTQPKN